MEPAPRADPLIAARELLQLIFDANTQRPSPESLARRLDAFTYSLRFLLVDTVASSPPDKSMPAQQTYDERYALIGHRFPDLGLYWTALSTNMSSNRSGEIATGDAIDDLTDIADELSTAVWCEATYNSEVALSALRWCYENHLWMHLYNLRSHIEEQLRG